MTQWHELNHAYGAAVDIPALLAAAEHDATSRTWSALWSRLCHQGTVYSASYAALPALTQLAKRRAPQHQLQPLLLAGAIIASADRPADVSDPHTTYAHEIVELTVIADSAVTAAATDGDHAHYIAALQTLLALQGESLWSETLDGIIDGEYEVECPGCFAVNYVVFGDHGHFTTADPMYWKDSHFTRLPLRPMVPELAHGLAKMLHDRARSDSMTYIAQCLTYAFGTAGCTECEEPFAVQEALANRRL